MFFGNVLEGVPNVTYFIHLSMLSTYSNSNVGGSMLTINKGMFTAS